MRTRLLAGMLASFLAAPQVAAETLRLVLLPIVVHSSAPDDGYVSRGLGDMLSARLEQSPGIAVVRVDDPAAATTRLDEALERAGQEGGDYVIFGAFTQFGDGASLDVHCAPLDAGASAEAAETRRVFIQSGTVGEIIPKLDTLAQKLAVFAAGGSNGGAPAAGAASATAPGVAPSEAAASGVLDEIYERLDALEQAVYDGIDSGQGADALAEGSDAASAPEPAGATIDGGPMEQGTAQGPENPDEEARGLPEDASAAVVEAPVPGS